MSKIKLKQLIKEELLKEFEKPTSTASTSSDVKNLNRAQQASTSLQNRAKSINTIQEFPGSFEVWFKSLGFQPGKVSKTVIRNEVEKVLTKLGYK
jgi:hypothetical protein